MAKKKRKRKIKSKIKVLFVLIVFCLVTGTLGYNCLGNILKINELKREKKELENQLVVLQEEKEVLESDISKLEDPDYIAKYVREKYLYSKEGELILRLD